MLTRSTVYSTTDVRMKSFLWDLSMTNMHLRAMNTQINYDDMQMRRYALYVGTLLSMYVMSMQK